MATENFFFALKGYINGEEGTYALDSAGHKLEDGWYFLLPGESDGVGPFDSRDEAKREFDKIKFPKWTMAEILEAMLSGRFSFMEKRDWLGYAGAEAGTVIAHDWDGFDVLASPVPGCSRLEIQAHDVHGNSYSLNTAEGEWFKL